MKYTLVDVSSIEIIGQAQDTIEAVKQNPENLTKGGRLQARAQSKIEAIEKRIKEIEERDEAALNQVDLVDCIEGMESCANVEQDESAHECTLESEQANDNTKRYIYARTSTTEQNVNQQAEFLKRIWTDAQAFTEQQSGKDLDRPVLNNLKDRVKEGDALLVLSVSRLGRNTIEVLNFIEEMKTKKVKVHVHDLGELDVTSSTGKIVLTTLAAVAEMQREEILEKQRIGIERAKAEGKYKGKQVSPKTIKKLEQAMKLINENGISKEAAAKAAGIGIASLYRHIQESKCIDAIRAMKERGYSEEEAARYANVTMKIFKEYQAKQQAKLEAEIDF